MTLQHLLQHAWPQCATPEPGRLLTPCERKSFAHLYLDVQEASSQGAAAQRRSFGCPSRSRLFRAAGRLLLSRLPGHGNGAGLAHELHTAPRVQEPWHGDANVGRASGVLM